MQEDAFLQEFATLFTHYKQALTLQVAGKDCAELSPINDIPCVALDRMISAARLAILEIEEKAQRRSDARKYYQPSEKEITFI